MRCVFNEEYSQDNLLTLELLCNSTYTLRKINCSRSLPWDDHKTFQNLHSNNRMEIWRQDDDNPDRNKGNKILSTCPYMFHFIPYKFQPIIHVDL